RNYYKAQGLFGMPEPGQIDYTTVLELNLSEVQPSIAGPKRPQDRIQLGDVKNRFVELFQAPVQQNGYNKPADALTQRFATELGCAAPLTTTVAGGGAQSVDTPSRMAGAAAQSPKNTSAWTELEMANNRPTPDVVKQRMAASAPACLYLGHGDVVIAA